MMFQTLAALILALVLWSLGYQSPQSDGCCSQCTAIRQTPFSCPCADEDHPAPMSVEDLAVRRRLGKEGSALMERGQTVDLRLLIKQLDRDSCQLELPRSDATVADSVELFDNAKDSVVVVGGLYQCDKCTRWHANTASGFVITSSGAVVTNYHVVNAPTRKALIVMTADEHVYPVERVLAASRRDDLAILQVAAEGLRPLPIAESRAAAPVGAPISVIGHPAHQYYSYTCGIISRYMKLRTPEGTIDAVSITADCARGSSGAPVLNRQGQVVAIVKSTQSIYYKQTPDQQQNLQMVLKKCIPTESLLKLIPAPGEDKRT